MLFYFSTSAGTYLYYYFSKMCRELKEPRQVYAIMRSNVHEDLRISTCANRAGGGFGCRQIKDQDNNKAEKEE
jgi:hypothetical protein